MALLDVEDLTVTFDAPAGRVEAVRGLSFSVEAGRTLAIVGESGSGKTVAGQTILGLTRGATVRGRARFEGRDLLATSQAELRAIRGARIGMVFQNPHTSFHPALTVGEQVAEPLVIHEGASRAHARRRAVELLGLVGIPGAARRAGQYPHEFSGGMLQRAMIAMAIALDPRLLIADEPTTALDVTVQAQTLRLLRRLQQESGMAMILITHDLGVVASVADDVVVMYAGKAMEQASRHALFGATHHPYTRALLQALPRADQSGRSLVPVGGQPPSAIAPPSGCPFHPRCRHAEAKCEADQPFVTIGADPTHQSACWMPQVRS